MERVITERKYTYEELFNQVGGRGNYLHIPNGMYDVAAIGAERTRQNKLANSAPGNGKFFTLSNMKEGYITIGQRY